MEPAKSFFVLWDGSEEGLDATERQSMIDATAQGLIYENSWSFGRGYGDPLEGDRVYLLRTGTRRGIVASGNLSADGVTMGGHWTGTKKLTAYVNVNWDVMLEDENRLSAEALREAMPEFKFPVLGSGRRIYDQSATALRNAWESHVDALGRSTRNPWLGGRAASKSERRSRAIPLQQHLTPIYDVQSFASYRARRAESEMVWRFVDQQRAKGVKLTGYQIQVDDEARPLFADVFDHTHNVLYEAKASASREAVRMALGQLLDYRRHIDPIPAIAVLLPERPGEDLLDLLSDHGVGCVYDEHDRFVVELKPEEAE